MDLVDIDKVLDNLELHEEAEHEQRRVEEQLSKTSQPTNSSTNINNGYIQQSSNKEELCFKAVSQVFNSLDDYCKNVESLESKNPTATVSEICKKSHEDYDNGHRFKLHHMVSSSKQELAEYENEVEESKDIHKFTEEKRNKLMANNDSVERDATDSNNSFSSESLTTSSNSTFSSGPSFEVESSIEEPCPADSKENDVVDKNCGKSELADIEKVKAIITKKSSKEIQNIPQDHDEVDPEKRIILETDDGPYNLTADENKSQHIEDLAQGLSSISITSVNFQSHSILPLETSLSSSLGKVLDNFTNSDNTSALSQLRDKSDKVVTSDTKLTSMASELPNTSVEVINESIQQQKLKMQNTEQPALQNASNLPQAFEYVQTKMEAPIQIQQPITFCSTMDDISDTELDSMLQEMDIDEEGIDEQPKSKPDLIVAANVSNSENLDNQKRPAESRDIGRSFEQKEDTALASSSGDHPNGDSFSQASTVEFSEIRPQLENDNNDVESENNVVINSGASSYSNSESSSLDGDIIRPKNLEVEADEDASRPQRPTSLDLPAIQAIDLYTNAGQTPPGNDQKQNPQPQHEQELEASELQTPSPDVEHHETPLANEVAEATGYSEDPNANLGKVPPIWVPDNMATGCMQCSTKFTMIKRRHHCRACGKVLCSVCCSQKFKLEFLTEPESRVCVQCYLIFTQRQTQSMINSSVNELSSSALSQDANAATNDNIVPTARSPNPNNPMEYCSTIPPYRQVSTEQKAPPSVIVPVGVLKKDNGSYSSNSSNSSGQKARKRKSVMFSDGIAPGSDLASMDQWNEPKQPRRQSDRSNRNSTSNNKPPTPARSEHITDATTMGLVAQLFRGSIPPSAAAATVNALQSNTSLNSSKGIASRQTIASSTNINGSSATSKCQENNRAKHLPPSGCDEHGCFIPVAEGSLPPIVVAKDESGCDFDYKDIANNNDLINRLQNETLKFAVQKNFFVFVKIVNLKCCLNRSVINFTTKGMHHVGNDEIIILLELENLATKEDISVGNLIPKDIFVHLNEIYNNAELGNPIQDLSHTSPQQSNFLGSRDYGGFIFIRPTFQCMQDIILPENPYLIGILIHRYEVPWAKVFPLRLMLRLGAQYRYYPCPHVSMVNRDSVYAEIAQTIINFLADFRNYTYTLPFIRGMYIHMEDRQTTVVIPRNRLEDVIKAINNSSDHILAFGGNFSKSADGHLVCMQNVNDDSSEMYAYSTQAINIQGQPRKVTGASFFVLNESLKTTSGLSGKCSIVEDGLMVQILPSKMEEVRNSLKNQTDVTITCGPVDADEQHTEIVCIKWVDNDKEFNIGVKSPIDDRLMDGISSMRVHASFNYSNSNYAIRLTDIYVIKYDNWYNSNSSTINAATTSDITRMTEQIARSTSMALVPFLDLLAASKSTKIGLRATLHQDNVCYEAGTRGSKLPPLYMNAMDNHLIPTLHSISSSIEEAIILELIFYILNV